MTLSFACRSGIYGQPFDVPAERTGWVCSQAGSFEREGQEFAYDQENVLLERQGIICFTIALLNMRVPNLFSRSFLPNSYRGHEMRTGERS